MSAYAQSGGGVDAWLLEGASNGGKTAGELQGVYADPGTTWSELDVDPSTGTYSDGTLTVTVTLNANATGFDWTSNVGVDAVVVKNGESGANFYVYDGLSSPSAGTIGTLPAGPTAPGVWLDSESVGDTGLTTPLDNPLKTISHITFCYDDGGSAPGNIIVEKQTDPDGSTQVFDFTATYGSFSLTDGQTNNSGPLLPGTYSVAETLPAGWTLTSAVCSDGSDPGAIQLDPGETVTVVFTNTLNRGQIIVEKQTDPDGSTQSFAFTPSYGSAFSLTDGQTNNSGPLLPGTYSVSETL
ncbi:MAG: hypothetical protein KBE04_14160, partial [Phycisphaerae bacterium]|nr:hypothetical protein [Phycisphaerae bacterium]